MNCDSDSDCTDTESVDNGPFANTAKKSKLSGAAKYKSTYRKEWAIKYNWLSSIRGDKSSFRCNVCAKNVSCAHQGETDVTRHMNTKAHQALATALVKQPTLNMKQANPLAEKITRAEVKMVTALIHHNVPLAMADTLSPLMADIFTDSDIAKGYASARTKTTCILNGALKPHFLGELLVLLKTEPFALSTDGSSDNGLLKMNPLTVRVFDVNRGRVANHFLDMCLAQGSTAADSFAKIDHALTTKYDVPWGNVVAMGLDNCSVNMGKHNSILSRATEKNNSIYVVGCPCHIIHNTSHKAATAYTDITNFDVEDFLVDLFYWFDHSSKRKNAYHGYCQFVDNQYRAIVKYVSTRWLSLEAAVTRVLKQYEGLKSYFLSESDSSARFNRLKKCLKDPMTEIHLLFYQAVLQPFIRFNMFLQREEPIISLLHGQINEFLLRLACKFLTVAAVRPEGASVTDIDYANPANHLPASGIHMGMATKMKLDKLLNDGDISENDAKKFYRAVLKFYQTAFSYATERLPHCDALLMNAKLINFIERENVNLSQMEYFISRFPHLLPFTSPNEMDHLVDEMHCYQLLDHDSIPKMVWEEAATSSAPDEGAGNAAHGDIHSDWRLDVIWNYIGRLKCVDGTLKFPRLGKIARLILCIPHSNAAEERVFSMVRKNKTPFRPSIDPDETLGSILTVKLAMDSPLRFEPTKDLLRKAKKATWAYNQAHSSKK